MSEKLLDYFDAVYLISLQSRSDRRKRFGEQVESFPFASKITTFNAIDGSKTGVPPYWQVNPGAWGCYRSHLNVLETAINEDRRNVLIFEDDAVFVPDFVPQLEATLAELPDDWDLFFLGGQHARLDVKLPQTASPRLQLAYSVHRSHALAINRKAFSILYQHLLDFEHWAPKHHVDAHIALLQEKGIVRAYAAYPWLVGQSDGWSDIMERNETERYWNDNVQASVFFKPVKYNVVAPSSTDRYQLKNKEN